MIYKPRFLRGASGLIPERNPTWRQKKNCRQVSFEMKVWSSQLWLPFKQWSHLHFICMSAVHIIFTGILCVTIFLCRKNPVFYLHYHMGWGVISPTCPRMETLFRLFCFSSCSARSFWSSSTSAWTLDALRVNLRSPCNDKYFSSVS